MKVLVAIDGSACSELALEEICRRPWPNGSQFKVLTAYEVPMPASPEGWALPPSYFEELDRTLRHQAKTILESAVKTLKEKLDKSMTVEGEFVPGPPKSVILSEAENWGANLIMLGSHGYRAWERFLLGSVSQGVVSHAKCSVEVVRCAGTAEFPKAAASMK